MVAVGRDRAEYPGEEDTKTTGIVTTAASHAVPLTSVPMTSAMLPAMASCR